MMFSHWKKNQWIGAGLWLSLAIMNACDSAAPEQQQAQVEPVVEQSGYPSAYPSAYGSGSPTPGLSSDSNLNLAGDWKNKTGQVCVLKQGGKFLTLSNSTGSKTLGSITSATTIQADEWGSPPPLIGTVSADQKTINWSNGGVWTR